MRMYCDIFGIHLCIWLGCLNIDIYFVCFLCCFFVYLIATADTLQLEQTWNSSQAAPNESKVTPGAIHTSDNTGMFCVWFFIITFFLFFDLIGLAKKHFKKIQIIFSLFCFCFMF